MIFWSTKSIDSKEIQTLSIDSDLAIHRVWERFHIFKAPSMLSCASVSAPDCLVLLEKNVYINCRTVNIDDTMVLALQLHSTNVFKR